MTKIKDATKILKTSLDTGAATYYFALGSDTGSTPIMTSIEEARKHIIPTTTRGDVIFRGASTNERLAKGTQGQIFQMGADDPAWIDIHDSPINSATTIPISSNWAFDHNAGTGIAKHVPSGGSSGEYLYYNGTWQTPAGGSGTTSNLGYTASTGVITNSGGTDATISLFATGSTNRGLVIGSNGLGNTYFLRADGTWAVAPGAAGGTVSDLGYTAATGVITNSGGDNATISVYNGTTRGLVPDSSVGATYYLNGDGNWSEPAGGGGASISDVAYPTGWNGDTTNGASRNALYDKLSAMDTTIGTKGDGTIGSIGINTPTGLEASAPITDDGTITLSYTAGYSIPTTAKQGQWDDAYTHSTDNSQAHSDYLLNNANDETSGSLTATNFLLSSDITLKENIVPIDSTNIDVVKLMEFNFIDDEFKTKRYGVSAQELEKYYPELVHEREDSKTKTVDYIEYLLIKVDSLEKRLNKLENI